MKTAKKQKESQKREVGPGRKTPPADDGRNLGARRLRKKKGKRVSQRKKNYDTEKAEKKKRALTGEGPGKRGHQDRKKTVSRKENSGRDATTYHIGQERCEIQKKRWPPEKDADRSRTRGGSESNRG